MDLTPCPGCGAATFDLKHTAYGLCRTCEARMVTRVYLYAIWPDEVIRINVGDGGLVDLAALIDEIEDAEGTFVYRTEKVLVVSVDLEDEAVLL